jgi:hypothetical protein
MRAGSFRTCLFFLAIDALLPNGLQDLLSELHLRRSPYHRIVFIDNCVGHALDVVLVDQMGKLRTLDHIGGNVIAGHGELMGGANHTGAIWSDG